MKKKVLVVDDDPFARKVLKKFLRNFPCTVTEAGDGVQALALITADAPDLVLLDVNMPVLNGLQTLQEIRSSSTHSHLPVVSVSAYAERALVMRLIDLGISGFLVKPLRPDETVERLGTLFQKLKKGGEQPTAGNGKPGPAGECLLLVDHDPNFRAFVRPFLEGRFEMLEATSGAVGWQMFTECNPHVVCIAEDLQLLSSHRLVQMIRGTKRVVPPQIYLLSDSETVRDEQHALIDGVLRKSFVPDVILRQLHATLLASEPTSTTLAATVRGSLSAELVTATQQAIGVLASQEVFTLEPEAVAQLAFTVQARAELVAQDLTVTVPVGLFASEQDAAQLGSKILGTPVSLGEGAGDAVAELVNTIGGRVCASLARRGYRMDQCTPTVSVSATPFVATDWEVMVPFRTAGGERFVVAVWVMDGTERVAVLNPATNEQ